MRMLWQNAGLIYLAAAVVLGFGLAAGASLWPQGGAAPVAAAAIPPDRVVARLHDGAAFPPALRAALAALRADPDDAELALAAARLVVDEGRARGDSRVVGAALGLLRPFLAEGSPAVLRLAADARQYQHDFPGALALLDRAVALDPRDAQALIARATIHTVRGDYALARADCDRIGALRLPAVAFLCTATTHVTTAEGPAWAERLEAALAGPGALDPALHPWALGLTAEIARHQGDAPGAIGRLRRLLAQDPGAERERLILSDLLLARGEGAAVIDLLSASPATDAVLLRRALALKAAGNPEAEALVRRLDQRFRLNIDLGLRAHAREEAMFFLYLAGDPVAALARAEVNWSLQKEAEDVALILATASTAGRPGAARPARDWMAAAGVTAPPEMPPRMPPARGFARP
jgi:tetratricopeptide (TPR) repeat protein